MTSLVSKGRDISKEFSELELVIKSGRVKGRQKAIESALNNFEKAINDAKPERPWWKFWDRNKLEV